MRILRWIYKSVFTLATVGLLLVYLSSAFSDHLDPRTFHYLSYLGVGFHILMFITIAWMIVMLVLRQWWLSLATALCLIITSSPISRSFPLHLFPQETEAKAIKLLTYNTCAMGQTRLSQIKEKIPVLDFIRESGADIVCLQEYAFTLSKDGHTQERIRKSLSDLYPYYDYLPNDGRKAMGIALFSKFPIKSKARVDERQKNYVSSMYYELEIEGKRVALVNNHLQSNLIKPRDRELYDEMIEHFEKDSLERIHTGMIRSLGRAFFRRAKQSEMIRDFVSTKIGDRDIPVIICGDMNDTPVSFCYRKMRGNMNDAWQDAGFGLGTTYNRNHFWFRIDHIFLSKHFKTLDIEVLDEYKYSDHYPVMATFKLQSN